MPTYPISVTTRSGKGSAINAAEFDQNLVTLKDCANDLNTRLTGVTGGTTPAGNADKVDNFHASQTPGANLVVVADANGKADSWVTDASSSAKGKVQLASTKPGTISSSTSGTAGTATTAAKGDHAHDLGAHGHTADTDGGNIYATTAETQAGTLANKAVSPASRRQAALSEMRDTLGAFPGVIRPTLNLHAGLVSNDDCPLGTFSRSAAKWRMGPTGLMESVPADKVARAWDILGNLLGWSLEEQRTGRLWPSRDLTSARWVVDGITPLKNATGSDSVANSASTITATKDNSVIYQDYTASGAARAMGVRIKRKTGTGGVYISQDGGSTWTDITNSLSITEWYRASVVQTVSNPRCLIKIATNGDALYVDFFNLEDGSLLTSDIETVTGAVTRPADVWTIPTSAFGFNPSEGTVYVAATHPFPGPSGVGVVWGIGDGATYGKCLYLYGNDNYLTCMGTDGAGAYNLTDAATKGDKFRASLSYVIGGKCSSSLKGSSVVQSLGSTASLLSSQLTLGCSPWAHDNIGSLHVQHLAYFPRRLSNANLQLIAA